MNTSEEDEDKMSENTKESELKGKRSLTLYQPLAMQLAPVGTIFYAGIFTYQRSLLSYVM